MRRSLTMGFAATVVAGGMSLALGTASGDEGSSLRTELVMPKRQIEHRASVAVKTVLTEQPRSTAEASEGRREAVETVDVRPPRAACAALALAGAAAR